jgi:hypothetical protein
MGYVVKQNDKLHYSVFVGAPLLAKRRSHVMATGIAS